MTARSREYDAVPAVILTPHESDGQAHEWVPSTRRFAIDRLGRRNPKGAANATFWSCRSWSRCPAQALVRDAAVVALIVDAETP